MSTDNLPQDEESRAIALREKQLKDGNHILMFAPGDRAVLVATIHGGHTFGVGPQSQVPHLNGTPVHTKYQAAALKAGCVPESMLKTLSEKPKAPEKDESQIDQLVTAIDALMAEVEANPDLGPKVLTQGGVPDATILSQRVGFKVTASLRDEAFDIYNAGGDA